MLDIVALLPCSLRHYSIPMFLELFDHLQPYFGSQIAMIMINEVVRHSHNHQKQTHALLARSDLRLPHAMSYDRSCSHLYET